MQMVRSTNTMGFMDNLDPELLTRGVSLRQWGVNEIAWDKATAQAVAETARAGGYEILGGDVWRKDPDGRWVPAYDNWHTRRRPGEDAADYVDRCLIETKMYIGSYPDPEDGTIGYVLVWRDDPLDARW